MTHVFWMCTSNYENDLGMKASFGQLLVLLVFEWFWGQFRPSLNVCGYYDLNMSIWVTFSYLTCLSHLIPLSIEAIFGWLCGYCVWQMCFGKNPIVIIVLLYRCYSNIDIVLVLFPLRGNVSITNMTSFLTTLLHRLLKSFLQKWPRISEEICNFNAYNLSLVHDFLRDEFLTHFWSKYL